MPNRARPRAPGPSGEGSGCRAHEDAIGRARELGCYRVQLTSNTARPDAHRFYEQLGFVPSHVGFKLLLDWMPPLPLGS